MGWSIDPGPPFMLVQDSPSQRVIDIYYNAFNSCTFIFLLRDFFISYNGGDTNETNVRIFGIRRYLG